jgi:ethanolamine utilization protein EutN
MLIGEVVGRLWASRQADGLAGRKLLLVRPLSGDGNGGGAGDTTGLGGSTARAARGGRPGLIVAVDGLGAGPGERVIVAHGSRVRDITVGETVADKDIVVAIVDDLHVDPWADRRVGPAASARATTKGRR